LIAAVILYTLIDCKYDAAHKHHQPVQEARKKERERRGGARRRQEAANTRSSGFRHSGNEREEERNPITFSRISLFFSLTDLNPII